MMRMWTPAGPVDQPASTAYRRASTRSPSASAKRITLERDRLTCSPLATSGGSRASAFAIDAKGLVLARARQDSPIVIERDDPDTRIAAQEAQTRPADPGCNI